MQFDFILSCCRVSMNFENLGFLWLCEELPKDQISSFMDLEFRDIGVYRYDY